MGGCSQTHINLDVKPGPFFFHGFLRPVSRAREIENDAFHGLFIQFHGHFTGYFLNFTTFSRGFHRNKHKQSSPRTLESQALSDTGLRPTIPGQYC